MEVRNCRSCKRLFNYLGGQPICPECKDALERKFLSVRDFIRENPNHSLQEVAEENEVSVQQIRDWIREGRLELTKGSPISITCEKCGAPILKGRFCSKCTDKMTNNLNNLIRGEEEKKRTRKLELEADKKEPRMRFRRME